MHLSIELSLKLAFHRDNRPNIRFSPRDFELVNFREQSFQNIKSNPTDVYFVWNGSWLRLFRTVYLHERIVATMLYFNLAWKSKRVRFRFESMIKFKNELNGTTKRFPRRISCSNL